MPNHLSRTIFGEEISEGEYQFALEPCSISRFFKSMQSRSIPEYQRPYSWTEKHTTSLLHDIQKSSLENKSWFIGTVYTTKHSSRSLNGEILDGQQRLTTIQLILKEFTLFKILHEEIDLSQVSPDTKEKFNDLLDNARDCIYSQPQDNVIQRFKAEEITNDILKEYILQTRSIENRSELLAKLERIQETLRDLSLQTRTAKTLGRNIDCIREFLLGIYNQGEDPNSKLESLNSFLDTLLNRLWLIEVPLRNADLSLEIFEAINNRGKPLDLLDRLQFRSLTRLPDCAESSKSKWKELYIGVEELITVGVTKIFNDHTGFYKTLFLGLSGEELSDSDNLIDYFTSNFLNSEEELISFFEKANKAIQLFKATQSPHVNDFLRLFSDSEQKKITSVLQVLRRTVIESKNTNQLLVSIASNFEFTREQKYPIVIAIWNVSKLVLLKDVLYGEKSQKIRGDFNKIIKKANSSPSIYSRLFNELIQFNEENNNELFSVSNQLILNNRQIQVKANKFLEDSNKSLLRTNNNETAKLIQYYLAHYTDTNSLGNYSGEQYKNEELEHVFPRAYMANWSEFTYTKNDVVQHLNELKDSNDYRINIESLITEITITEDIELVPYTSAPHTTPNRLIEWHGNKHILSLTNNRKMGNRSFEKKKEVINDDRSNLVVPGENSNYGISEDTWDYKKIIQRSLKIVEFITFELFNKSWDDTM